MSDYETQRLAQIEENKALMRSLGISNGIKPEKAKQPPTKKRKTESFPPRPTRSSARLALAPKPRYSSPDDSISQGRSQIAKKRKPELNPDAVVRVPSPPRSPPRSLQTIIEGWTSWKPTAPEPIRDAAGNFHFESHTTFKPNKSPAEIIREGAFGGTYFKPLWSNKLQTTVQDDYQDTLLPQWRDGLSVERFLTSESYDPEVNKFGVQCGQSIEQWEAAGWIMHQFDIRGWFQWYCRFFRGRRCEDDDRQVSRWAKCVGEKGRWRRILVKKYLQAGVRSVVDEGDEEMEEANSRLSPTVHQVCHHWAWEIRQDTLDQAWQDPSFGK
jgi:hypothetical protein